MYFCIELQMCFIEQFCTTLKVLENCKCNSSKPVNFPNRLATLTGFGNFVSLRIWWQLCHVHVFTVLQMTGCVQGTVVTLVVKQRLSCVSCAPSPTATNTFTATSREFTS